MIAFRCAQCGVTVERAAGDVNRAYARGLNLYCGRTCSGLGRRTHKTTEQAKAEKAAYDADYRVKNREMLKVKKADYHQRTYDPAKAAAYRKTRMPAHVEYCRRPEYRAKKRAYDQRHKAEKMYGPFADAFLLLMKLEGEIRSRMSRYEIAMANGTICKSQNRRREYERLVGRQSQDRPLGNPERDQERPNAGVAG